jgi:hypothetical protein
MSQGDGKSAQIHDCAGPDQGDGNGNGAVPLAIGTGMGSELRRPLGISIIGGLIVSQVLTLYTTPVIYLFMDTLRLKVQGESHAEPLTPREATS